jgi:hypothetical protein
MVGQLFLFLAISCAFGAAARLPPCATNSWGRWGSCSKTCETGVRTRQRSMLDPYNCAGSGGTTPVLIEHEFCARQPCKPCATSSWAAWGSCSKTCETGIRSRKRKMLNPTACSSYGKGATPLMAEHEYCARRPCPIACIITPWTEWSPCTKECNIGEQSRSRRVLREARFSRPCPALRQETRACGTKSCDAAVGTSLCLFDSFHGAVLLGCQALSEFIRVRSVNACARTCETQGAACQGYVYVVGARQCHLKTKCDSEPPLLRSYSRLLGKKASAARIR